jgi:hypothetical protein
MSKANSQHQTLNLQTNDKNENGVAKRETSTGQAVNVAIHGICVNGVYPANVLLADAYERRY